MVLGTLCKKSKVAPASEPEETTFFLFPTGSNTKGPQQLSLGLGKALLGEDTAFMMDLPLLPLDISSKILL